MGSIANKQLGEGKQYSDKTDVKTRKRVVTGRNIVVTPANNIEARYDRFLSAQEARTPEGRAQAMGELKLSDPELVRFIDDQMNSDMGSIEGSFREIRETDKAFYSVLNAQTERTAKFIEGLSVVSEEVNRDLNAIDTTGEIVSDEQGESPVLYLPDEQSGIRGTKVALKDEIANDYAVDQIHVPNEGKIAKIKQVYKKLAKKISDFFKPFFKKDSNNKVDTVNDTIEPPLAFSTDDESGVHNTKVSSHSSKDNKEVA